MFYSGRCDGCSLGVSEVSLVDRVGALAEAMCSFPNIGSSGSACRVVNLNGGLLGVAGSGSVVAIEPERYPARQLTGPRDQAPSP